MDQKTWNFMTMQKDLNPWDIKEIRYESRIYGGRGLARIEDLVDASTQALYVNVEKKK